MGFLERVIKIWLRRMGEDLNIDDAMFSRICGALGDAFKEAGYEFVEEMAEDDAG